MWSSPAARVVLMPERLRWQLKVIQRIDWGRAPRGEARLSFTEMARS